MSLKPLLITSLLVCQTAFAGQTLSSSPYGIELPVPEGWTPRTTDTSLTISSNKESNGKTVVVGVQFYPSYAPYTTALDWRERTLYTFVQYLEANAGRLLTPASKGAFQGEPSEDASYLGFDYKTGTLYAGYSRFVAHEGKGYELFIIGDTLPLYTSFTTYQTFLNAMRFVSTSSIERTTSDRGTFGVQRISHLRYRLVSDQELPDPALFDLQGVHMEADLVRGLDGIELVLRKSPASPFWIRSGNHGRMILP